MNWKKKLLKNFKLYAITDLDREEKSIFRKIDQALEGGAGLIQLRSKTLLDAAFLRLALKIAPRVRKHRGLFFINDRVHLALVCGDGVHLGQDDLPYHYARRILGNTKFIGRSTHSLAQALRAEREGHDYIGVGPVFGTPTKPGYAPVGLRLVSQVAERIRIPFAAIGGINSSNAGEVIARGARSIAAVRAIFKAPDIREAAKKLVKIVENSVRCCRCDPSLRSGSQRQTGEVL